MPKLKTIQKNFYKNIFQKENTKIIKHINETQIKATDRLTIYRNTIIENLRNALQLTYPAIWKLLGNECANSVARVFIKDNKNLPDSAFIDDWGGGFPDFLQQFEPLQHLIYLSDVARLEWFHHRSYCVQNTNPFKAQKLKQFSEEEMLNLQFKFNSSVFFYHSQYALQPIFALIDNPENTINLEKKDSFAIILRYKQEVQVFWVEENVFNFLMALQQGLTLENAFIAQGAEFNLPQALQFMLNYNMIWKVVTK
jgi:hypothetical protein